MTRIASDRTSPKAAREFVHEALRPWPLPEDLVQRVLLATSELVTNAIEHGRGDPVLVVEVSARAVALQVRDEASKSPTMRPPSRSALGGRGLLIVEALSNRWGHSSDDAGKWVWAEFARA